AVQQHLAWLDRTGRATGPTVFDLPPGDVWEIRLSMEGKRAAVTILDPEAGHAVLWSCDLQRGTRTRLSSGGNAGDPVWSPDGRRIFFSAEKGTVRDLWMRSSDGEGPIETFIASPEWKGAGDWSPDGRWFLFSKGGANKQKAELWAWSAADQKAQPFLRT